jgi:hypothetical protein
VRSFHSHGCETLLLAVCRPGRAAPSRLRIRNRYVKYRAGLYSDGPRNLHIYKDRNALLCGAFPFPRA